MNELKKKIFISLRNHVLKNITNKLGKIKNDDEKIICYVDNKKLKRYKKGKWISRYKLFIKSNKMYSEEILNTYKINKPIHYVIKGMNFKDSVEVFAPIDTTIVFGDCKFNREFNVFFGDNIILENNEYYDEDAFYRNSIFFCTINAKSVKFLDDNFINKSKSNIENKFGIKINSDNLEIINSTFSTKNNEGVLSIKSKQVYIEDSTIKSKKEIYINADDLKVVGAKIKSQKQVVIDNKNNNYIAGVTSPKTIYNGVDLTKHYFLNPKNLELQKARISLIEKLRELRDNCININFSELKEVENNLNNRSIVKTLKK